MKKIACMGLLLAGWCGAQSPAIKVDATPALWKVKGVHGTVYLFGSVHVMKPEVKWESAKVKEALKSSDALWLEVANVAPDSVKTMQPMIMQMGMDFSHPLSTKISKSDVELMDTELKTLGMPGISGETAFEPMQPWFAYLTLSMLPAMQSGYAMGSGIDQKLLAEAKSEGKPVKGFETAEQQLHYVADMPQMQQVALLHQTLVDLPKSSEQMDEIVADWTRGDVEKIASLENSEMKTKTPELYEKLLVKRNEQFADAVASMLKDPATGTVFVTIGAAHLAGPDSVLKMLEAKGFKAERVE
jgi:uncharacterized protein YbaP (TraB family)